MSSAEIEPSVPEKRLSKRKMLVGFTLLIFVLAAFPFIARTVILLLHPIKEISLQTLNDPNAIKPENVTDVQLLAHWGNGAFNSIAWSPDGDYFVIGTTLGVNLYDSQTYQLLRYVNLPLRGASHFAFSPDSTLLAAAAKGSILLLDLANDKILQSWDMCLPIDDLVYLEDGSLVCVAGIQEHWKDLGIFKLVGESWQMVNNLDDDFVLDVAFVPEEQVFVVFYKDSVRLVDPLNGKEEILPYTVPFGGDFVLTHDTLITVDRDTYLMSAYEEGTLLTSIDLEGVIDQPLASPDGSLLAAVGPNPSDVTGDAVTFWRLPELQHYRTSWVPDMSTFVSNEIAFSPTGNQLALLVSSSVVKIFPTAENNTSEIIINDPFASIADITITPEGEIRALSCSGTAVDILKLPSAIPIDEWYFDEPTCGQLLDHGASVAISEPYEPVYLYRVGEYVPPVIVKGRTFSSDGSVGAAGVPVSSSGDPETVMIWQREFGLTQKWDFYQEEYNDFNVAVSPSGKYVAATNRLHTYLWVNGIKTGQVYPPLISSIVFSPDENYLASVNGILELETGRLTATEKADDREFYPESSTPAFSPDGQILAAEVDGTLRFWDARSGALLAKLDDPDFANDELIFSSDGRYLVGLGDGFVKIWGHSNSE